MKGTDMSLLMISFVIYFLSCIIMASGLYWFRLQGNMRDISLGVFIARAYLVFTPVLNTAMVLLVLFLLYVYEPYIQPAMKWKPFAKD
jgi:hypothetical protein